MEAFEKFFFNHIYGKEWNEIDGDILCSYSDWHKDVFGFRPHGMVCGQYVSPYAAI